MKVTPVGNYKTPQIPNRDDVDDNPEILKNIPLRWLSNAAALTALAGTVLLISQYKHTRMSRVAPIFNHGNGIVQFGGVADFGPVHLDEAEARDIIRTEALRSGIELDPIQNTAIKCPIPEPSYSPNGQPGRKYSTIYLDGVDEKRHIYYKYITTNNASELSPDEDRSRSFSWTESTKAAAQTLRNELKRTRRTGVYGIFYDPVAPRDSDNSRFFFSAEKENAVASRQLLRAQVQDFIKWLKTEGII